MKSKSFIFFAGLLFCTAIIYSSCESEMRFSYSDSGMDSNSGGTGMGGSFARFAIKGDYLYTVNGSRLTVFDIANPKDSLVSITSENLFSNLETIFPYGDYLFLGTTTGMIIMDVSTPNAPEKLSVYSHIYSCDPVVVKGKYAYVTLHTDMNNNRCSRGLNELQVIDISNVENPIEKSSISLKKPMGLGVDGDLLFVCDDSLRVFNNENPLALKQIKSFKVKDATDVIAYSNRLILTGSTGIDQYSYSGNTVVWESKLYTKK